MTSDSNVHGPFGDGRPASDGVMAVLRADMVATVLYLVRIATILSCIAFLFSPFFADGAAGQNDLWYRRALLASAASWALRLHQRLRSANTNFSTAIREKLLIQDSFHYLMYSIGFAFLPPISVSLMPLFMYALMHVCRFTQSLLDASSPRRNVATGDGPDVNLTDSQPSYLRTVFQSFLDKVNTSNESMLRWIALNEIMLMIICVFMAVSGPRIFVLPFLYYPFLKMRYCSRNNPYTRTAFSELRMGLQMLACHSKCPTFVGRLIHNVIQLGTRMCPATN